METTHLYIALPVPFDFSAAVYSHGWVLLAPNHWDPATETLHRVERLFNGEVAHLTVNMSAKATHPRLHIKVRHPAYINKNARKAIKDSVGRMFRLGEDFQDFYTRCETQGGQWTEISTQGWGRLLRSPTVFEDIVKTICTTNIQWGGTKAMVQNLVTSFGDPYPLEPHLRTFPAPAALAAASETELSTARLGYRAPFIQELAQEIVEGKLDLRTFENPDLPTDELQKALLEIKGVGPYAAHTILMLLGRYEHLAYDTVMRDFLRDKYDLGDKPTLDDANRIYKAWGKWKFLAYWFEIWSGVG